MKARIGAQGHGAFCPTRSGYYGAPRPHLYNSHAVARTSDVLATTVTNVGKVVYDKHYCSWCGKVKRKRKS